MNAVSKGTRLGFLLWVVTIAPVVQIANAQETPSDYQQVLKVVGKTGDYKSNVLKVNIPRNDLKVSIDGIANAIWVRRLDRNDERQWRT